MPNRMLKESTFTSDKIASLSDFEFRLWVGLITYVDDAGRGDARPAVIRGRLFALRERVTIKDISDALHSLAAKGCVSLYDVNRKPYLKMIGWEIHQQDAGRRTPEYKQWRKDVFTRDNYTCQMCGNRGGKLVAHHKKRYRNHIEDRTNLENGVTLCENCHKIVHHKEGK